MQDITIMIVDDEARMRKLIRDFLVKEDYKVIEASNGVQALEIFSEKKRKNRFNFIRCNDAPIRWLVSFKAD